MVFVLPTGRQPDACIAACGDVLNVNFTLFGALFGLLFLMMLIFRARFQNQKIYFIGLALSFFIFIIYFVDFSTVCGSCGGGGTTFSYSLLPSNIIPEWLQEWLNQVETNRLYDISI